MELRLWALIAILSLMVELCQSQSQLESRRSTELTLDHRQAGEFDAEFPEYVYRGETERSPADVEKDGGFYSRGVQKQRAGTVLSPVELQEGSSLFHHAGGETAEITRYISTSADPGVALTFAVMDDMPDQKGYIYKIHADERMIDVNRSLGKYSPYVAQKEHAAIGFIEYDQIEGWWEVTYNKDFSEPKVGKESQEKLRHGKFKDFKMNSKYSKISFQGLRGAGAAPQLAGFPKTSQAWQEDTWKQFKTRAVEKSLDELITSVCAGKGKSAKRDAGCMARLGHQDSIHSTGPSKPKTPNTPSTPEGPDGKPTKKEPGYKRPPSTRPPLISYKIRVTKAVGTAAAFTLLLPHARNLLEAIKEWDNPIGDAVKWFDEAIASLQEAIGGPQRYDIDGNDLKAKLICALKGGNAKEIVAGRKNKICIPMADEFKEDLESDFKDGKLDELIQICTDETYHGGDPHVWEWFKRRCAALRRTHEYAERIWEMGLNGLLDLCSGLEGHSPENRDLKTKLKHHCDLFNAKVEEVENANRVTGNGESIPANAIAEDYAANEEAREVMGLYSEEFRNDSVLSGTEPCWSASGLQSSKPSGWDLVSSALTYYDENSEAEVSCRACQKEDEWVLRCGSTVQ